MSTVVLGVCGGIAAYKSAMLVSLLKKAGMDVHVVMTKNACQFVSELTFETLSANAVTTDTFSRNTPHDVWHISLAKRADITIIAPATANIIAKSANGMADDFLSTYLLATKSKLIFAPAMNTAMFEHSATQHNLDILRQRGCEIMLAQDGLLACGDTGKGRMAEPEDILSLALKLSAQNLDLAGKNILVTAGPTVEAIDEVRFLTNRSTGKMGYAIAQCAAKRGANVTLISGPVNIQAPEVSRFISVKSAQEMYEQAICAYSQADIVIKTAAVADYTPKSYISGKMEKSGDLSLELVRTKDILAEMGKLKQHQILVGFAAQTHNLEEYAKQKLAKKNLDMICANDVSKADIGFGSDNNSVLIIKKDGSKISTGNRTKFQVADAILDEVRQIM